MTAVRLIGTTEEIPRKVNSLKPHIRGFSDANGESNLAIQTTQDGSHPLLESPTKLTFKTSRHSTFTESRRNQVSPIKIEHA